MPPKTVWKAALGDVEPVDAFPTDKLPTIRDVIKLFRYLREEEKQDKRDCANTIAEMMATRNPGAFSASPCNTIKHLMKLWDNTL